MQSRELQALITKLEKEGDPLDQLDPAKEELSQIMREMEVTTWAFHKIEPKTIDLEHMDQKAMETFQRMFMYTKNEEVIAAGTVDPGGGAKDDDRKPKKVMIDTNGDGNANVAGWDTTGDGVLDSYDT